MMMGSSSENGKLSNSLPSRGAIWERQYPQPTPPPMLTSLNDFINSLTPQQRYKKVSKNVFNRE